MNEAPSYSPRDYRQVLANSLVATISSVLFYLTASRSFLLCFVVAFAEALADTCSSSLGAFSKTTVDIFKFRKCEKGISGGMSLCGTLAAAIASLFMGTVAFAFSTIDVRGLLIVTLAGFSGALFDSFLGSLFQVKYKCSVCGRIVEREIHCEAPTEKCAGIRFFTNDLVNLLSTAFSAIAAAFIYLYLCEYLVF